MQENVMVIDSDDEDEAIDAPLQQQHQPEAPRGQESDGEGSDMDIY